MRAAARRGVGVVAALLALSACTGGPDEVAALPPACPGSEDPAYLYTVADDGSVNICGVRPDRAVVRLTTDGGSGSPSFTPDGRSVVFSRAAPGMSGGSSPPRADSVWIMCPDGSDARELARLSVVAGVSVPRTACRWR